MKIYCAGAIKGDTAFQGYYKKIIEIVESCGHVAYSEINPKFRSEFDLKDKEIFKRDIEWLKECDYMIAEVSGASLGVGFEISYALYVLKIPVLILVNKNIKRISAMISGCDSDLITFNKYSGEEELRNIIYSFLEKH